MSDQPPSYGGERHPRGTTVLVLGILSLACCGLLGPVAWIMGNNTIREIDAMPGRYSNRGIANAGRICGMVGTAFLVISLMFLAFGGAASLTTVGVVVPAR